jgi:hypothetical protein
MPRDDTEKGKRHANSIACFPLHFSIHQKLQAELLRNMLRRFNVP